MSLQARIFMVIVGIGVLAFVIDMVRTRRLRESYALLWLLAGVAIALSPFVADQLDQMALRIGFSYAPALLLMLAIIGLLLIIFQLSLSISKNTDQIKSLVQELALLRNEVESLTHQLLAHTQGEAPAPQPDDDYAA